MSHIVRGRYIYLKFLLQLCGCVGTRSHTNVFFIVGQGKKIFKGIDLIRKPHFMFAPWIPVPLNHKMR